MKDIDSIIDAWWFQAFPEFKRENGQAYVLLNGVFVPVDDWQNGAFLSRNKIKNLVAHCLIEK